MSYRGLTIADRLFTLRVFTYFVLPLSRTHEDPCSWRCRSVNFNLRLPKKCTDGGLSYSPD